ncbi:type II toxin-antitoxin system HigB family toxin [Xanthobacter sp. 91]|uniref:type II toxin-antitoxin system HigB family toxin n=1 Tax=Xanthobacter sp. 91 TaxID=1117244 RepID=UPI0009DD5AE0|nr:type II toxin-antitoxin system HigB family toxin [Xanthobacter sp. 91]
MHILSMKALRDYWETYKGADQVALEQALKSWYREVKNAQWSTANEIKDKYRSASILKNGRVVFNICGNKFRLIVGVNYKLKTVYVKWVGTHADYDGINAEEV